MKNFLKSLAFPFFWMWTRLFPEPSEEVMDLAAAITSDPLSFSISPRYDYCGDMGTTTAVIYADEGVMEGYCICLQKQLMWVETPEQTKIELNDMERTILMFLVNNWLHS